MTSLFTVGYFEEVGLEFLGLFSIQDDIRFFLSFLPFSILLMLVITSIIVTMQKIKSNELREKIIDVSIFVSLILYVLIVYNIEILTNNIDLYIYSIIFRRIFVILLILAVSYRLLSKGLKRESLKFAIYVGSAFFISYKAGAIYALTKLYFIEYSYSINEKKKVAIIRAGSSGVLYVSEGGEVYFEKLSDIQKIGRTLERNKFIMN